MISRASWCSASEPLPTLNGLRTHPRRRIQQLESSIPDALFSFLRIRIDALSCFAPIVFFANLLQKPPGRVQFHLKFLRPGLGEDLGVVDCNLIRQGSGVDVV